MDVNTLKQSTVQHNPPVSKVGDASSPKKKPSDNGDQQVAQASVPKAGAYVNTQGQSTGRVLSEKA